MRFSGKSVYKGIALGQVMVIRNQDIPVKHKKIDDIEPDLQVSRQKNSCRFYTARRLRKLGR